MWICSKYGFYSIVWKEQSYVVRARVRNDLENLKIAANIENEIITTDLTDYRFRLYLDPPEYQKIMEALSDSVDYGNFKDTIHQIPDQQDKPYCEIWAILANKYGSYFGWVNLLQKHNDKVIEHGGKSWRS